MKISDRLMGTCLILFSLFILYEIQDFPSVPGQSFGSDLLPRIIAFGLIAGGSSLIISDLRSTDRPDLFRLGDWISDRSRIAMVVAILLGTLSFIPFVDMIGFPLLSAILLVMLFVTFGLGLVAAVPASLVVAFGIHTIFSKMFLVPLPWGLLEPIAW